METWNEERSIKIRIKSPHSKTFALRSVLLKTVNLNRNLKD